MIIHWHPGGPLTVRGFQGAGLGPRDEQDALGIDRYNNNNYNNNSIFAYSLYNIYMYVYYTNSLYI